MSGIEGRGKKNPAAKRAEAGPTVRQAAKVKRPKTGGRKKSSLEEEMARARMASEIAGWHDDTTLNEDLAAIYLGISVSQLGASRAKPKDPNDPRGVEGPPMIKIIGKGAVGQNQQINYKLGALREYQAKNTSNSSFDSALKAGLLGWMTAQVPFFAKVEYRKRQPCIVICGNAWNMADPRREHLFMELVQEKIRLVSLTPKEAALSPWDDVSSHKAFAKIGLALLRKEAKAVKTAIGDTETSVDTSKKPPELAQVD